MEDSDQRLRYAINLIINSGYQLDIEALILLKTLTKRRDFEDSILRAIEELARLHEKPLFMTKEFLESSIVKKREKIEIKAKTIDEGSSYTFKPYAKEVEGNIEVLDNPTERVGSEGGLRDYLSHFKDRFTKLERILRERSDTKDSVTIAEAHRASLNSKLKTIGIVVEKIERRRNIFIQIEDFDLSLTVMVPSTSDRVIFEKTRRLFVDQVVCVEVTKVKDNLFIARDLIIPDIPERKTHTAAEQVYAILTSDIHAGSKLFLKDSFTRFIRWLRGSEGNNHQREIASRVKYIVIAGDIVDGVGIYPEQEKELAIDDLYEQYNAVSKLIEAIPEYIEIIIVPGNHDATRQALPQPAILRKYAKPLYNLRNVRMLGDPARIRLHGIEVLVYHGRSLDDIIGVVPDVTYLDLKKGITTAMKYLLKTRHLAPIYGLKTPIAPVPIDDLIISSPPDIFHAGHTHVMGYELYRGTLLINSGAWQKQTDYQKKMGLLPMPGIVPVVDLNSLKVMPINFLT